jgi:hypothetical protein
MRRNVTLVQLREIVTRRLTKGAAFMKGDYTKLMADTREMLSKLSFDEIKAQYPNHTYDIGRER